MSKSKLLLTEFHVRKLQCSGMHGSFSPYQITMSTGEALGSFGKIMEPDIAALNIGIDQSPRSWLERLRARFS